MQSNIAAVRDLGVRQAQYEAIRQRWRETATPDWVAQM
jgi:hypothetical protein